MNIILTGITGNIGHEVARILSIKNHKIIPIVRTRPHDDILPGFINPEDYIIGDLEKEIPIDLPNKVDCVVHCAGSVHFKKMGNTNELMMTNIISLIEKIKVPLYYVSTAYLCKPNNEPLFNKYEEDKQAAENVLNSSNVSSTIFRPSIITGNSKTGEIVNFSGYYLMVQALIKFLENSDKIRFPSIDNYINIVPVDWVAESIVSKVEENSRGTFFITNTNPPLFNDLLIETLKFFKIDHKINLVDCSFEEYDHLDLNSTEREIFDRCKAFIPYIETKYHFQNSIYDAILEPNYIQKILSYFVKSKNERME